MSAASQPTGALSTRVGLGTQGSADGDDTSATFNQPGGLALTSDGGGLYVVELGNRKVRAVKMATREVTTLAGDGAASGASLVARRGL